MNYDQFAESRKPFEDPAFTLADFYDFARPFCKLHRYSLSARIGASGVGRAFFTPISGTNLKALEDPADGIFNLEGLPQ